MINPDAKVFTVTLEIEARNRYEVVKMIEKLVDDRRTISYQIEEQKGVDSTYGT